MASILDWMVRNETKYRVSIYGNSGDDNRLGNNSENKIPAYGSDNNVDSITSKGPADIKVAGSPFKSSLMKPVKPTEIDTLDKYIKPGRADSKNTPLKNKKTSKLFDDAFTPADFEKITEETLMEI